MNTLVGAKGMDFGRALNALKSGERVARAGWNGKGMWVALTPGSIVNREDARAGACAHYAKQLREDADTITIGAHIDMKAADGTIVIGWLASQTDMLAEDWVIVETERVQGLDCYHCEEGTAHVHQRS